MSAWHEPFCRRLDLFTSGGISSCLSCGSVQPEPDPPSPNDGNIHGDIYQTLKNDTDMRLLILEPGGYDDPVRGTLHLTTTSGFLEYDAISYTWAGEDENMERSGHIMLNSQSFTVTPNCEAALRRARSRSGPKTIWIDAICINQGDLQERGHQVRLMQQIYSRADSVLLYLGEPSQEEDELLAFISGEERSLHVLKDRNLLRRLREALCRLFQRRYFSRVWILQEVALARRATLVCGEHSIPWSLMDIQRLDRIGLLEHSEEPGRHLTLAGLDRLPAVLNFRAPAYRDPSKLLELLDATSGSQASDPRDKIFALLGLLTCPENDGLIADYTRSTAETYTFIAIWVAQRFGLPELLSRTCDPRQRLAFEDQKPQWVPNWALDNVLRVELAPGDRPPWKFEQEPAKAVAAKCRLPVSLCGRDISAINFPAFLLGTATQVLQNRNRGGNSAFTSVPSIEVDGIKLNGQDYITVISDPDSVLENTGFVSVLNRSRFIHLNYTANIQKTDDGKTYESIPPNPSETVEISLAATTWIRDLIYLIPEPRQDGFQFTEPGFVSVSDNHGWKSREWTHTNKQGSVTTGTFSDCAVCCSEHREGHSTRLYLCGLLEHRITSNLRMAPRNFEFVSAR